MEPKSFEDLIAIMCDISPTCRTVVDTQSYLINIDQDEVTSQKIAHHLLSQIVSDLADIGVEFHCHLEDLCDNRYNFERTVTVAACVLPSPLYKTINETPEIVGVIQSILDGNTPEPMTDVLALIEFFSEYERTSETYHPVFEFIQDKIWSDSNFKEYLISLMNVNVLTINFQEIGIDIVPYIKEIKSTVRSLTDLSNYVIDCSILHDVNIDITLIHRYIVMFQTVSLDRTQIHAYAWMSDSLDRSEFNDIERLLYEKYSSQYKRLIPFFPEYFVFNDTNLTVTDYTAIMIGIATHAKTKQEFRVLVENHLAYLVDKKKQMTNGEMIDAGKFMTVLSDRFKE